MILSMSRESNIQADSRRDLSAGERGSRKPREDASTVRERAIGSALALFAARGFDATSVAEISAAAGLGKQALLYHFHDKESLRRAALARAAAVGAQRVPPMLQALLSGDPIAATTPLLLALFQEEPDVPAFFLRELMDRGADAGAEMLEDARDWLRLSADFVRAGQDLGRFRSDLDPEAFVISLATLLVATGTLSRIPELPDPQFRLPPERRVREAVRILAAALLR
jgi:AcrR family transcriptional regulator